MKFDKFVYGVATLMELVAIGGIAGIALKRNKDCYNAEMKYIDAEYKLALSEIEKSQKENEIVELKNQLEELQKES